MALKQNGPSLLRAFRKKNEITLRGASSALGVKHPSMRAWERGLAVPSEPMRKAIARWTDGAVPEESWPLTAREKRIAKVAGDVAAFVPKAEA